MPNIKSAEKALRQSHRRRAQHLEKKRGLNEAIKSYKKAIVGKKSDEAKKHLSIVYKKLDKAAKTDLIKKNRASRLKSRLTKLLANH